MKWGPFPIKQGKTNPPHKKKPSCTACNNTQGCFAHVSTCASGLRPDGFLAKPGNSQGILTSGANAPSLRCSCSLRAVGLRSGGLRPTALSSSRNRLSQKTTSPCLNVVLNAGAGSAQISFSLRNQPSNVVFAGKAKY
jgi:hypothetical protein